MARASPQEDACVPRATPVLIAACRFVCSLAKTTGTVPLLICALVKRAGQVMIAGNLCVRKNVQMAENVWHQTFASALSGGTSGVMPEKAGGVLYTGKKQAIPNTPGGPGMIALLQYAFKRRNLF